MPRVFSYAIPPGLDGQLEPGHRVRLPFRGATRLGVVVEVGEETTPGLEPVTERLDPVPALTPALLALARWAAEETVTAWGEAVLRALPPTTRGGSPVALTADAPVRPAAGAPLRARVVLGKERVARVAQAVTQAGSAGVLVLAPEIETARRWAERLRGEAGEPVALLTSGEPPRRRWSAWWGCRQGTPRIAVGTRAAAFLPVRDLGVLVVVDEEDPAHKAPDSPRWHARELALRRADLEGARCTLASGAPSLETWARLQRGEAELEEASGEGWPSARRVDLRAGPAAVCLSAVLVDAAREALARGEPVLLIQNRLGYGSSLACAECGLVQRCPACRLALVYFRERRVLACRLCGHERSARSLCGRCRGRHLVTLGWGTEQVEEEARQRLPGARVVRYDGTVSPEGARAVRAAFQAGDASVVVGTQMALGLLALRRVGVAALVAADATLALPDFRAGERTFQLAWHLGEGVMPGGSLWLQSHYPDHPALVAAASGIRAQFYDPEWQERQELGYPPARRMARLLVTGRAAAPLAADLAVRARAAGLTVLGPAPLPGARLQVVLLGDDQLPAVLASTLAHLRGRRRLGAAQLAVDVDPVELP